MPTSMTEYLDALRSVDTCIAYCRANDEFLATAARVLHCILDHVESFDTILAGSTEAFSQAQLARNMELQGAPEWASLDESLSRASRSIEYLATVGRALGFRREAHQLSSATFAYPPAATWAAEVRVQLGRWEEELLGEDGPRAIAVEKELSRAIAAFADLRRELEATQRAQTAGLEALTAQRKRKRCVFNDARRRLVKWRFASIVPATLGAIVGFLVGGVGGCAIGCVSDLAGKSTRAADEFAAWGANVTAVLGLILGYNVLIWERRVKEEYTNARLAYEWSSTEVNDAQRKVNEDARYLEEMAATAHDT